MWIWINIQKKLDFSKKLLKKYLLFRKFGIKSNSNINLEKEVRKMTNLIINRNYNVVKFNKFNYSSSIPLNKEDNYI